jgi:hypothetical protein
MTLRTFYTVNLEDGQIENIESFKKKDGFLRIHHYPQVDFINSEIFRLDPKEKFIPLERVKNIESTKERV